MHPLLRLSLRGTLLFVTLLVTLLAPESARAIQLRWSNGSTDLTASQNTRVVLVVQADSAESALPDTWRLQWTADTLGVGFAAFDPSQACLVDTAKVDSIGQPESPADSAANEVTAYFCSSGSSNAATAYFLVDLPGGTHGKMRVVALSSSDSTQVVESNEVTFNGGVGGEYAPVILRIASDHTTTTLRVHAIGTNLSSIQTVSISVPGESTATPLAVDERTDSAIVASAEFAGPLPTCAVRFATAEHQLALGQLSADVLLKTTLPYRWRFRDPDSAFVYPKDFALIDVPMLVGGQWQSVFHLYYIRSYTDGGQRTRREFALGHAWSRDLANWNANRFAFVADTLHPTNWDGENVWAPSILLFKTADYRDSCVMFYTGVNSAGDQTIGYATAPSVDTLDAPGHWTRRTNATLTPANALDWVKQLHPWKFRDPFVMANPESPTGYLLFYTAAAAADTSHNAVGVFQSVPGSLDSWTNKGHYAVTEVGANSVEALESPHVFPDSSHHDPLQSAAATWRLMYTDGNWSDLHKAVLFNTKAIGASLTETQTSSWPAAVKGLGDYLNFTTDSPEYGVQASEILPIGGTYYWGGYNGDELVFRKVRWSPVPNSGDFYLADVDFLAVDKPDFPRTVNLRLEELRFGSGGVYFRLELPARMRASVVIYDVMGRVVRPLVDREIGAGAARVAWDGCDRSGAAVGSGIYFARLRAGSSSCVVRVPFVR